MPSNVTYTSFPLLERFNIRRTYSYIVLYLERYWSGVVEETIQMHSRRSSAFSQVWISLWIIYYCPKRWNWVLMKPWSEAYSALNLDVVRTQNSNCSGVSDLLPLVVRTNKSIYSLHCYKGDKNWASLQYRHSNQGFTKNTKGAWNYISTDSKHTHSRPYPSGLCAFKYFVECNKKW